VDDILAVAVRTCGKNIITTIMKHWKCSDMEVLGAGTDEVPQMGFLGMTLCHVPKKGIFVHQMEYVRGLLAKHQMENSNPSKVLLPQEDRSVRRTDSCRSHGGGPEVAAKCKGIEGRTERRRSFYGS
jgi:hypothetical protein